MLERIAVAKVRVLSAGLACRHLPIRSVPFILLVAPPAVAAGQPRPVVRLQLPAGPISQALVSIALATGCSIGSTEVERLAMLKGPLRLHGSMEEVLEFVLRDSGLAAVRSGPKSWRVVRKSPAAPRRAASIEPPQAHQAADIVVTGSKLATRLDRFPGAVTVLRGAALDDVGGSRGTEAIEALYANLLSTRLGTGRNKLFLRGVADSSFNGPTPALVGQYLGDLRLTYASPDPDLRLYDMEQVEILEGPQGGLYGAGSLGGIIRAVPRRPEPTAHSGELWAGISSVAHGSVGRDVGAMANISLGRDTAVRLLAYDEREAGYIDDVGRSRRDVNRGRETGGRIALQHRFGSRWRVTWTAFGQNDRNADSQYADRSSGPLERRSMLAQPSYHRYRAADVAVDGSLASIRLTSTTGHIRQSLGQVFDASEPKGEPSSYRQIDHIEILSNESRLSGSLLGTGEWLLGVAGADVKVDEIRSLGPAARPASLGTVHSRNAELTSFMQATLPLAGDVDLTVGWRLSGVFQTGRGTGALARPAGTVPVARSGSFGQWLSTPTVALTWEVAPNVSLVARYAGGYRPGGLTASGILQRFRTDTVRTFELGVRSRRIGPANVALRADASITRWRDIQADEIDTLGLPFVQNIGDGWLLNVGAQLEVQPLRGLRLSAGGFVSRSRVRLDPEQYGGRLTELPNVAHFGSVAAARYVLERPGFVLDIAGNFRAVGPSLLGVGPELAYRQGDFMSVSTQLALHVGGFVVSLDLSNLLDTRGNQFALGTPFALATTRQVTPLRPRTVRLGLKMRL